MTLTRKSILGVILAGILALVACAPSTVTLVNLVVNGSINALKLAATIGGPQVSQSTLDQIQSDGNLLIAAYTEWNNASGTLKPGLWPKVQEALGIFQHDIPAILQAVHINDPAYGAVASFVIDEINTVASAINGQNGALMAGHKGAKPALDAKAFKSGYNAKMVAAGHPELQLK